MHPRLFAAVAAAFAAAGLVPAYAAAPQSAFPGGGPPSDPRYDPVMQTQGAYVTAANDVHPNDRDTNLKPAKRKHSKAEAMKAEPAAPGGTAPTPPAARP